MKILDTKQKSLVFENLELLKEKGDYPYEYMNSFERFNEEKLPARKYFYSSTKDGKIGDDGKISDSHISVKDYLTCEKFGINLKRTIWGLSRSLFLKKMYCYQQMFLKSLLLLKILWV